MTNLIATFQDRFSDWLTALSQHFSFDSSCDLCDFPDFAKYHYWAKGN